MNPIIPDYIVCPICKGTLSAGKDPKRPELLCPRCALAFEVRNGIPVMIPERARTLSEDEVRSLKTNAGRNDRGAL